jgi:hypothetical protein
MVWGVEGAEPPWEAEPGVGLYRVNTDGGVARRSERQRAQLRAVSATRTEPGSTAGGGAGRGVWGVGVYPHRKSWCTPQKNTVVLMVNLTLGRGRGVPPVAVMSLTCARLPRTVNRLTLRP